MKCNTQKTAPGNQNRAGMSEQKNKVIYTHTLKILRALCQPLKTTNQNNAATETRKEERKFSLFLSCLLYLPLQQWMSFQEQKEMNGRYN